MAQIKMSNSKSFCNRGQQGENIYIKYINLCRDKRLANKLEFLQKKSCQKKLNYLKNHITTLTDKGNAEDVIDLNLA